MTVKFIKEKATHVRFKNVKKINRGPVHNKLKKEDSGPVYTRVKNNNNILLVYIASNRETFLRLKLVPEG